MERCGKALILHMAKTNLIIFTNAFPCDKALEHYLEHEMPYLSKKFTRIIILPGSFGSIKIPVPDNVEVMDLYSKEFYKGNSISFIRNLGSILWLLLNEFSATRLKKSFWLSHLKTSILSLNNAIESAGALDLILRAKNMKAEDTVFYTYWFYHSALILSMAKRMGIIEKFISRGHQAEIYEGLEPEKSLFKNIKLKNVDSLFLISEHASNYLNTAYPQYSNKYNVAYLGVKDNGLNPETGERFTIVSCSKYAPHKRLHLIPEILRHSNFELDWYHLGYIPEDAQKEFRESLKDTKVIAHLSAMDQPNEKVLEFYKTKHIDLFVNVSSIEGLSVALIEAGSFGITLMATDINGTREIVTEETGYLLPVNFDASKAAAIIDKMYGNKSYHKRTGARNLFQKRFNSALNFNRFIEKISV